MSMLLRNFFYAVGLTALCFLFEADPNTAGSDLIRFMQSACAQQIVLIGTAILIGLEFALGGGSTNHANGEGEQEPRKS